MKSSTFRVLSLILVLAFCLSSFAFAVEIVPLRASDYINSYSAETSAASGGSVSVSFVITGTKPMDSIGASLIYLYEYDGSSWSLVKTFASTNSAYTSSMIGNSTAIKTGSVSYSGVSGRQYYAIVTFFAQLGSGGDTRNYTTLTVKAP